MKKEYTTQELIEMIEAKATNGKISLDEIAKIVLDANFPEHLSKNAVEKLIELSSDYKRFRELGDEIKNKCKEVIRYAELIIELNSRSFISEAEEDIIVSEISEIKNKQNLLQEEIAEMEIEFKDLHKYFKNILE